MNRSGVYVAAFVTAASIACSKPGQDRRFDLPSIGPRTVDGVAAAGLAGLAVVAGGTIVAEPQALVEKADRAGIFVVGMRQESTG